MSEITKTMQNTATCSAGEGSRDRLCGCDAKIRVLGAGADATYDTDIDVQREDTHPSHFFHRFFFLFFFPRLA